MVRVYFQVASHFPVNRKRIRDAITRVLKPVVKRNTEVSICIIGNRQMRKLNLTYRQKNYPTDVLSFPLNESSDPGKPFIELPDKVLRLGDIVVSFPQAVDEARKSNRLVDEVVDELVLHGLNHLLGIHHEES